MQRGKNLNVGLDYTHKMQTGSVREWDTWMQHWMKGQFHLLRTVVRWE